MPTRCGLAAANSATSLVNVLNSRVGEPDATAQHDTAGTGLAAEYGVPVAMKLVLVVRIDLGMGRGKIAAQVAHAAVAATLASLGEAAFHSWLEDGHPKVVLKAPTAAVLDDIIARVRTVGLPVQLVHDAGRTQVASGTLTCCAIGPAQDERVDAVTAGLSLL